MRGLRVLRNAEYKTDLINEMMSFPVGVHDDAVDALGLVGQLLDKTMSGREPEPEPVEEEMEEGYVVAPPTPIAGRRRR